MAVGRHFDAQFPARHLLVAESELRRQSRELRLIRRLLEKDEDQEGKEAERNREADDPADHGNTLQQHDDERRTDGVKRKVLPFGEGGGHDKGQCGVNGTSGQGERCKGEIMGTERRPEAFLTHING